MRFYLSVTTSRRLRAKYKMHHIWDIQCNALSGSICRGLWWIKNHCPAENCFIFTKHVTWYYTKKSVWIHNITLLSLSSLLVNYFLQKVKLCRFSVWLELELLGNDERGTHFCSRVTENGFFVGQSQLCSWNQLQSSRRHCKALAKLRVMFARWPRTCTQALPAQVTDCHPWTMYSDYHVVDVIEFVFFAVQLHVQLCTNWTGRRSWERISPLGYFLQNSNLNTFL